MLYLVLLDVSSEINKCSFGCLYNLLSMMHVNMYDCSSIVLEKVYVGMDDLG